MPYVRPATMRMSTNGITSLLDESRFYSSADTSVTADSSTQNDDNASSPGLMNGSGSTWQNNVSASFAQLAVQFQAASQNIAAIQTTPTSEPLLLAFTERLEAIEEQQQRLAGAIEVLREQFESINSNKNAPASTVNDVEPASPIVPSGPTISDLEALLKAQQEAFKLDQEQLPAKLQNALATKSLSPIRMPPMKNRKQPTNAPATRGEFEHLTKERYEAMLQAYGIPFSGDITAKRELLRAFLGIPSLPLDKK
ncbi:hypothetical protein Clacol_003486 [Clathrus columnatus]|uniref:Uncharacterized protein n=1 Tax=Clathrus columnatus TaxID=1419009 RepID=A0AAV5A947_9AGAM|nr:hypothetical protein Clacol_003486 [Clathrus columnatus]